MQNYKSILKEEIFSEKMFCAWHLNAYQTETYDFCGSVFRRPQLRHIIDHQ